MKKILIIDDAIERLNILKENCNSELISYSNSVYDYFIPTDSGKKVSLAKPINEFDIIFIHKSINDTKLPETIFIAIKNEIDSSTKLFSFSGGSKTSISDGTIERDDLYSNFTSFVKFCTLNNEWFIPALFDRKNFEKLYIKKNLEQIRKLKTIDDVPECIAYLKVINILGLQPNAYSNYSTVSAFVEKMIYKIENNG